jgi:hypothetical protein
MLCPYVCLPPRPLFVAEAEYRAGLSKYLARSKKALLALFGLELLVVDVAALDADAGCGGDVTAASALRCVPYAELLSISLCGPGGASLRIEHGAADKARLWGLTPAAAAATAAAAGSSSNSSEADVVTQGAGYAASVVSTPAPGATAVRVTSEAFTLSFADHALATKAAAAILFQQAQHAALRNWLSEGLHAGFRCGLVSIQALPLHFGEQHHRAAAGGLSRAHSLLPPHVLFSAAAGSVATSAAGAPGTSGGAATTAGGAGPAAAAAAPYPWADALAAEGWGCSVPLPASWGAVLDAAAAGGAAAGGAASSDDGGADEPDVTLEELSCPVALEHGPKALQVCGGCCCVWGCDTLLPCGGWHAH